ncbi:hypothetical protein BH09VER1_BH09VER1_50620 [soil metagenome]
MFKRVYGWGLAVVLLWGCHGARGEAITTTLTKVAELPLSGSGGSATSPQSPRGGILQVGNELWFTTYSGGEYSLGAIVSYNLETGVFTTEHSFGLPDPTNPATARYDGFSPWKTTLTLGADGLIYYATQYGGASWTTGNNGGAVGAFDPATVQTTGVTTIWSGQVAANQPRNLAYASPIYIPQAGGGAAVYFNTYAGGSQDWGTVQKVTLDASGQPTGATQITQLTGSNSDPNTGRQAQGGILNVNGKLYYTTASTAGGAAATLQVLDTATDTVSVLSTTWTTGASNGGWSTPVYDSERNAIYSLALSGGILKWDLTTGVVDPQSLLANSADGVAGSNFANPILFGESLYYIKQAQGTGENSGGSIWRYDLESEYISLVYNLKDFGGKASSQSGTLSIVTENGVSALYFLTADDTTGDSFGALYRLDVAVVPEPGTWGLCALGLALTALGWRRRR